MMSVETYLTFLQRCLIPFLPERSLLLLDAWTTFGNERAIELLGNIPGKEVQVVRMPKGTTRYVQPLDRYGFGPWKAFKKYVDDHILLNDIRIGMTVRDRELKKHSLMHNQFAAPRFQDLFRYSFHLAGYYEDRPGPFLTPVQYCFPDELPTIDCHFDGCQNVSFIRCAHGNEILCWEHFFEDFHYHNL